MSNSIETRDISRRFGESVAVDKVNLSINSGEIFGLLGPNAAGKSTIIRLLAGILRPSSGDASILGLNLLTQTEEIKKMIVSSIGRCNTLFLESRRAVENEIQNSNLLH